MDAHGKHNEQKEMSDKQDVDFAIFASLLPLSGSYAQD